VVRKRVFWVIKTRNACGQLPCHEINLRNGRHACKKSNSLLYHTHRRHHESDQIMSNLWLIYSQTQGHVSKNCELVFGIEAIITKKPTKRCCRVNGCWFSAIQTHGARASKWEKCYIDASGWAAARKNNDSLSIIIGTLKERCGKLSRDHFLAHELRRRSWNKKEPLSLALACAPLLFNSFCLAPILSSHVPAQVSVSLENPDRKVSISLKEKRRIW
jgi:hypothetical protein